MSLERGAEGRGSDPHSVYCTVRAVALTASGLVGGLAVLFVFYAQPSADDFARAVWAPAEIPGYVAATYRT